MSVREDSMRTNVLIQFIDTFPEALFPWLGGYVVVQPDFIFIHYRIKRSFGRSRKISSCCRLYNTGGVNQRANFPGKLKPGNHTLITKMVDTRLPCFGFDYL